MLQTLKQFLRLALVACLSVGVTLSPVHAQLISGDGAGSGGGGSSGALVLIGTCQTASNSASLNFTTQITSTYNEYLFEISNLVSATSTAVLWMRYSTNGGSSYDSTGIYYNGQWSASSNNFQVGGASEAVGQHIFNVGSTNTASNGGTNGFVKVYNPLSATANKLAVGEFVVHNSDGHVYLSVTGTEYRNTTAANALQFLMSSGNITSGTICAYGVTH